MKRLIAAAALVMATATHSAEGGEWFAFAVLPDTLRAYENSTGAIQYDAVVMVSGSSGSGDARVGVVGCHAGRGQTARVDDDGSPATAPHDWVATRGARRDQVALSICLLAIRLGVTPAAQPAPKKGMV